MERWRWCQAIEAAGGLLPLSWCWLEGPLPSDLPSNLALILTPGCGPLDPLAERFPGRRKRLLVHPLTPRQRCLDYPCQPPDPNWILLIGDAAGPNTWEARPLYGQRIALTRERSQAEPLRQRLEALGAEVILCPVLEFVPPDPPDLLTPALEQLESYSWILFTSPNGVRFFFEALEPRGDVRRLASAQIAAIGPGTARALLERGVKADLVPAESVAEGLLAALASHPMEGKRVLLPRAQQAREILPSQLRARGARVDVVPCYKTVMPEPPPHLEEVDRVVLMSSSSARHFRQLCSGNPECVCIGPVTAETAREQGFTRLKVARQFDLEGVIEALIEP
jgi:uroporphyrinogen III methyltransferase/synthase